MEVHPTLDLLKSNNIFACDTAAKNHFVKSKEGSHNCQATEVVSWGMTGEVVKTMELVIFYTIQ